MGLFGKSLLSFGQDIPLYYGEMMVWLLDGSKAGMHAVAVHESDSLGSVDALAAGLGGLKITPC